MAESGLKLYKIRWLIAVALVLFEILQLANVAYGVVNNVYVDYFQITYAQVDVMGTAPYATMVPLSILLAFCNCSQLIKFRKLMLLSTGALVISLLLNGCAFLNPSWFKLAVVGQVCLGLAKLVANTIPATFAVLWFADDEVGTGVSMCTFGGSFGDIFSVLLVGYIVASTQTGQANDSYSPKENISGFGEPASDLLGIGVPKTVSALFLYNVGSAVLAFCIFLFFLVFVADFPPTPPTHAQALKRDNVLSTKCNFREMAARFWQQTRKLFDITYVVLAVSCAMYYETSWLEMAFLGEILRNAEHGNAYGKTSTIINAYYAGCLAGCVVGGKVVDRYKNYTAIIKVGNSLALLAASLVVVAIAVGRYWLVIASNVVFGAAAQLCLVALLESVTQHTFPLDECFVNTWMAFVNGIFTACVVEFGRLVHNSFGGLAVLFLQVAIIFVGTVIAWTVKIELGRANVEKQETTRLLK